MQHNITFRRGCEYSCILALRCGLSHQLCRAKLFRSPSGEIGPKKISESITRRRNYHEQLAAQDLVAYLHSWGIYIKFWLYISNHYSTPTLFYYRGCTGFLPLKARQIHHSQCAIIKSIFPHFCL